MRRVVRARAVAQAMSETNEHTKEEPSSEPGVELSDEEPETPSVDDVELAPEHELLRGQVKLNGESFMDFPRDYIPVAESIHELFKLSTLDFEGPLDLFLF